MTSKKKISYKDRIHKEKIQIQQERKRLKELPKALQKLETELSQHVQLMNVFDAYIDDFTDEIIPVKPVKNPFVILNQMDLNLQHRNALNIESLNQHIIALDQAFSKMGFYLELVALTETATAELYELLYYYINNPPKEDFELQITLNYNNLSLTIERCDREDFFLDIPDTPDTMNNIQKYVDQLIEDLDHVAKNPPTPAYYETPPHLEQLPDAAELSLTPYKTLEELTNIKEEMFPDLVYLVPKQCQQVNEAIFRVFDALNIELVDVPKNIPREWLYDVLTSNWQHYVQYLPEFGMDLELCTGDPETCPYGDCCNCGEDFDIYELPDRFDLPVIEQIVRYLLNGKTVFLNPDTIETEYIYEPTNNSTNSTSNQNKWNDCIIFFPLNKKEWLNLIALFMVRVEDESFQEEIFCVINSKNAVENFNILINNSEEADHWFDFQFDYFKDKVRSTIYNHLHKNNELLNDDELPF